MFHRIGYARLSKRLKIRNLSVRKRLLMLACFVVFVGCGVVLTRSLATTHSSSHQQQAANSFAGLPLTSHTLIAYPRPAHKFREISEIVNRSSEILIGIPVAKKSRQSSGPNSMILTDYDVKVLETIKGDQHPGRTISLQVPGGSVVLADGTVAETAMPQFWQSPQLANAYIFFLKRKKDAPAELIGGPQGLFAISPWPQTFSVAQPPDVSAGRVIAPQAPDSKEMMTKYNGKSVASFVGEIKRLTGNGVLRPNPKTVTRR